MTDLDRMLRDAMRVEPGGDFAARIRTRVADSPRPSRGLVPRLAIAALACVLLALVSMTRWRGADPFVAESVLPHRDLNVLAEPLRAVSSPPRLTTTPPSTAVEIMVSPSEMLALQELFSGTVVAPPPLLPPANELSIPEIVIEPLAPLASGPEGGRQ